MNGGPKIPQGPKKPLNAWSWSMWIMGGIGKGVYSVAKYGGGKLQEHNHNKYVERAVNDIHSVMYSGVLPPAGRPLPRPRTTPLSATELQQFTKACNGLVKKGVTLPTYVTDFATHFNIRLRRK